MEASSASRFLGTSSDSIPPPDRRPRVSVRIELPVAERFYRYVEGLGRASARRYTLSQGLDELLRKRGTAPQGRGEAAESTPPLVTWRPGYEEVVWKDGLTGLFFQRTRWGTVALCDEDLLGRERVGEPIEIEEDFAQAREALQNSMPGSRHIPVAVRRHLHRRYGGFCAYPGCDRPWEVFHHLRRFALEESHDPSGILPLCHRHEELAHSGLIDNELSSVTDWRIRLRREIGSSDEAARANVDEMVLARRKGAVRAKGNRTVSRQASWSASSAVRKTESPRCGDLDEDAASMLPSDAQELVDSGQIRADREASASERSSRATAEGEETVASAAKGGRKSGPP